MCYIENWTIGVNLVYLNNLKKKTSNKKILDIFSRNLGHKFKKLITKKIACKFVWIEQHTIKMRKGNIVAILLKIKINEDLKWRRLVIFSNWSSNEWKFLFWISVKKKMVLIWFSGKKFKIRKTLFSLWHLTMHMYFSQLFDFSIIQNKVFFVWIWTSEVNHAFLRVIKKGFFSCLIFFFARNIRYFFVKWEPFGWDLNRDKTSIAVIALKAFFHILLSNTLGFVKKDRKSR